MQDVQARPSDDLVPPARPSAPARLWRTLAIALTLVLIIGHGLPPHGETAPIALLAQDRGGGSTSGVWTNRPSAADAAAMDDLGVGWARVSVIWSQIEPADGAYRWGDLDEVITRASRGGRRPTIGLVRNNPSWAARSRCRISSAAERGRLADFTKALANRYKGRVTHWMFYNEPDNTSEAFDTQHDLGGCFGTLDGSTVTAAGREDYARMIEAVGRAVREADRDVKVVMGGVASANFTEGATAACPLAAACLFDRQFLRGVLSSLKSAGTLDLLDGVAIHYFSSQAPVWATPENPDLLGRVAGLRADMTAAGLGAGELKSIFVEEGSYTGQPGKSTADPNDPFNRAQRDYVTKALARAAAADVAAYFWFWLQDTGGGLGSDNAYGLVTTDGARKPSYHAMKHFLSVVDRFVGRLATGSSRLEGYEFRAADGRRVQVVWSVTDGEADSHALPADTGAVTDPTGAAVDFGGGNIRVGTEPRFIFLAPPSPVGPVPAPGINPAPVAASTPASAPIPSSGGPAVAASGEDRRFPTGFRITNDRFRSYFDSRGGVRTFGYPISREFRLLGFPVQFFQGHVLQLMPNGTVSVMNLLQEGLMPVTRINGSTLPPTDPALTAGAPRVGDPTYAEQIVEFTRRGAPNEFDGMPVRFFDTFTGTVDLVTAFPAGDGNPSLLPLLNLEIWGTVLSRPMVDPNNSDFVYQRYQRSIMHYRNSCRCTERLLLAEWFKTVITGVGLPADLADDMATSPFIRQYDNNQTSGLARPDDLPDTEMRGAFEPD